MDNGKLETQKLFDSVFSLAKKLSWTPILSEPMGGKFAITGVRLQSGPWADLKIIEQTLHK